MSDPRMMGNTPPSNTHPGNTPATDQIEKTRSMFNGTDAAVMSQRGDINSEQSVAEYFRRFGVDVNAPGSMGQVRTMFAKQLANANPLNKMSKLAGRQGGSMTPSQGSQPPASPPPSGGDMDQLLTRLRR